MQALTLALTRGIYTARLATSPQDMADSLALRQICFRVGQSRSDADRFDAACQHVLVKDGADMVASFRIQTFAEIQTLSDSYTAQFYDLTPLQSIPGPKIELGRFCLHPAHTDPDILRLAWGLLTQLVDQTRAKLLFGCSSFTEASPDKHLSALGYLAHHHLGPETFQPRHKSPEYIDLLALADPHPAPALPPLLKTYLTMGGWVSDHAVLDRDLDTTHVFVALDIAAIPAGRARALRALSG